MLSKQAVQALETSIPTRKKILFFIGDRSWKYGGERASFEVTFLWSINTIVSYISTLILYYGLVSLRTPCGALSFYLGCFSQQSSDSCFFRLIQPCSLASNTKYSIIIWINSLPVLFGQFCFPPKETLFGIVFSISVSVLLFVFFRHHYQRINDVTF